ncbi:hypothetical protein CF327_g5388 [Tilletia walkeri]|uniref:Origin recognition complex subunit 2 RecA-like domain-containing protein n=1 Tax=Tilletia walkeri TaxID=117179 RepID=A0A8X7NGE8_9BASI|nr:hypothetical protein CF327_g5388 [Tilletia walkeri]KAE8271895.1 hypothetical protein A4X09_0g424 [Tilletia walkeri]
MKTRSRGGGGSAEDDDQKKGTAPTPPPPAKKRGRQPKPKTEELESTPSSSSSAPTAKRRRTLSERTTTTAKKSTPSSDRKQVRPETPPPAPASGSNSSTSIPHHQPIRNESSPHASALIAVEIVSPSKRLAPPPPAFQQSSPSAQNAPRYAVPQHASSTTTAALTQELTPGPLVRPSADASPSGGGTGSGSAKGKEKAKTAADARRMEKGLKSLPPLVDQRNSWLLGKSKTSGTPPSASSVRSGGRTPPQTRGGMARGPASITPTASRLTRASELGNSSSSSSRTHRPSPLGPGRTTSILPRTEDDDDDDVFSEDDLPANASASMLERITKGIEADLQGTPSLIRPSSSDAFFLAFSPSARTASTLASATSTPRGGGKKRARLADGIDAVGTTSSSSGNDGAGAGVGAGAGNIASGNAVLSMKVGTIRSTATKGLLPRRREGASDEEEEEEEEDAGDEDAALRRWKRVWGTVNVPPRPKLHPSMKLVVGGKGKSKATTTSTKQNPFKTFVPPFATHTLLALSTAHFRADSSSVPKYAFNTSSHKSGGRGRIRGDDSEEEEEESYSPNSVFAFWLSQLQAGFSLVFYGVGIGALPDTLPRPPRSLPAPLFKSQPSMLHTTQSQTSRTGDGIRAPLRPRPQHLLETFVRDVCEAGHGCAWIGHGMAPSSSSSGAGGGGRASGGLKIEDVLSGCEGAVRTGWGRRLLEEEGEGESDEDEEREGVSRKKADSGLPPLGTGANKAELRAQRLVSIFSGDLSPTDEDDDDDEDSTSNFPPALFILIHSLDAPSLIQPKVQRILAILGSAPRIHLLGTVRNVNAGLAVPFGSGAGGGEASGLTSSLGGGVKLKEKGKAKVVNDDEDETMEAEDEDGDEEANEKGTVSAPRRQQQQQQRLRWIWHSISTFLPSLPEALTARHGALVGGVPSVLDFSGRGGAGASASALRTLGESSAHSILRSVSKKCRSLFLILAWEQLRRYPARANPDAKTQEQEDEDCPVSVDRLIELASAQFVASNVNELGPLLKEFETHHLVERGVDPGPPPESWITIKLERMLLEKVLGLLDGDKLNEVGVHIKVLEEAAKGGK